MIEKVETAGVKSKCLEVLFEIVIIDRSGGVSTRVIEDLGVVMRYVSWCLRTGRKVEGVVEALDDMGEELVVHKVKELITALRG